MYRQTYRQFLRLGLRAVDHRHPQAFVLRKVLRGRFEQPAASDERIGNTLQFFRAAADVNGLERRCILTLLHYHASAHRHARKQRRSAELAFNEEFMAAVVAGVNETQQMCL